MLTEACALGDAGACSFAGRMWLDGRGVPRDEKRGIGLLVRACDGGVALACVVGVRWLGEPAHARDEPDAVDLRARLEAEHACLTGEPEACYQVGLLFYFGRNAFPRDRTRAVDAYERGCRLGAAQACNNLGDALAYGDGVPRDVARSASMFDRACRMGEALGCANSGQMFERGEGVARDRARARELYRLACAGGEIYGCLHAEMLAAQDAGVPRDPEGSLGHWRRACDRRDPRACAYVGILYEDGPDGLARDADKSLEAMQRACELGEPRACAWVKDHGR
jgi:uncharacterized protein